MNFRQVFPTAIVLSAGLGLRPEVVGHELGELLGRALLALP